MGYMGLLLLHRMPQSILLLLLQIISVAQKGAFAAPLGALQTDTDPMKAQESIHIVSFDPLGASRSFELFYPELPEYYTSGHYSTSTVKAPNDQSKVTPSQPSTPHSEIERKIGPSTTLPIKSSSILSYNKELTDQQLEYQSKDSVDEENQSTTSAPNASTAKPEVPHSKPTEKNNQAVTPLVNDKFIYETISAKPSFDRQAPGLKSNLKSVAPVIKYNSLKTRTTSSPKKNIDSQTTDSVAVKNHQTNTKTSEPESLTRGQIQDSNIKQHETHEDIPVIDIPWGAGNNIGQNNDTKALLELIPKDLLGSNKQIQPLKIHVLEHDDYVDYEIEFLELPEKDSTDYINNDINHGNEKVVLNVSDDKRSQNVAAKFLELLQVATILQSEKDRNNSKLQILEDDSVSKTRGNAIAKKEGENQGNFKSFNFKTFLKPKHIRKIKRKQKLSQKARNNLRNKLVRKSHRKANNGGIIPHNKNKSQTSYNNNEDSALIEEKIKEQSSTETTTPTTALPDMTTTMPAYTNVLLSKLDITPGPVSITTPPTEHELLNNADGMTTTTNLLEINTVAPLILKGDSTIRTTMTTSDIPQNEESTSMIYETMSTSFTEKSKKGIVSKEITGTTLLLPKITTTSTHILNVEESTITKMSQPSEETQTVGNEIDQNIEDQSVTVEPTTATSEIQRETTYITKLDDITMEDKITTGDILYNEATESTFSTTVPTTQKSASTLSLLEEIKQQLLKMTDKTSEENETPKSIEQTTLKTTVLNRDTASDLSSPKTNYNNDNDSVDKTTTIKSNYEENVRDSPSEMPRGAHFRRKIGGITNFLMTKPYNELIVRKNSNSLQNPNEDKTNEKQKFLKVSLLNNQHESSSSYLNEEPNIETTTFILEETTQSTSVSPLGSRSDTNDGQYHEINPGQYKEVHPGQYHEVHPGQYNERKYNKEVHEDNKEEIGVDNVTVDFNKDKEQETHVYNVKANAGDFIIGEAGKIDINSGQTLQGVRYTAVEGEVDLSQISDILQKYFGAQAS